MNHDFEGPGHKSPVEGRTVDLLQAIPGGLVAPQSVKEPRYILKRQVMQH